MKHKARLAQLEKRTQAQHGPQVIELIKHYEDGHTEIETIDLRTAQPSEILQQARELQQAGAKVTDEQRAALISLGIATHEQTTQPINPA